MHAWEMMQAGSATALLPADEFMDGATQVSILQLQLQLNCASIGAYVLLQLKYNRC